ncbi:MAG: hypothetical protein U0V56_11250 [Actinomycetota bacterium]
MSELFAKEIVELVEALHRCTTGRSQSKASPIAVERAEGAYRDVDGKRYIDFNSSWA